MAASTLKDSRIEFKTTKEVKDLLTSAASTKGVDLTTFVLELAVAKAQEVLMQNSQLHLTMAQQKRFCDLLMTPPAPSPELLSLMQGVRLATR